MGKVVGPEENDVISVHSASETSTAASGDGDTLNEEDSIPDARCSRVSRHGILPSPTADSAVRADSEEPPVDHGVAALKLTKAPAAKKSTNHSKRRAPETSPVKAKCVIKKKRTKPASQSYDNSDSFQNGIGESSGQPHRIRQTPNEGLEVEQRLVWSEAATSHNMLTEQKSKVGNHTTSKTMEEEESTQEADQGALTVTNEMSVPAVESSRYTMTASSKAISKESLHHAHTAQTVTSNTKKQCSSTMNSEAGKKSSPQDPVTADPAGHLTVKSAITKTDNALKPSEDKPRKKPTFDELLLSHMRLSFKPFTLKTLALELQSTETIVNFSMLSMVDKSLVVKKDFSSSGGNKVKTLYWANHGVTTKDLSVSYQASPEEMEATKLELVQVSNQNASIHRDLAVVKETFSIEELECQLNRELSQLDEMLKQLADTKERISSSMRPQQTTTNLNGRNFPPKSGAGLSRESCPRRLKMRINNMRSEWINRKQKCIDFIENLADGLEKKPKEVIKLLDIETDEAIGVNLPPKRAVEAVRS